MTALAVVKVTPRSKEGRTGGQTAIFIILQDRNHCNPANLQSDPCSHWCTDNTHMKAGGSSGTQGLIESWLGSEVTKDTHSW